MSRRFVLSALAAQDLDEILTYVLEQSGHQRAQHVAEGLRKSLHKLAESPGLGHKREDLTSSHVLFYMVWSYLVIYRPNTNPLEIVRVLHGARDVYVILGGME